MIPVCDNCGRWVERDNRGWPGYCGTRCRDNARDVRLSNRGRRRAARRGDPTARASLLEESL